MDSATDSFNFHRLEQMAEQFIEQVGGLEPFQAGVEVQIVDPGDLAGPQGDRKNDGSRAAAGDRACTGLTTPV